MLRTTFYFLTLPFAASPDNFSIFDGGAPASSSAPTLSTRYQPPSYLAPTSTVSIAAHTAIPQHIAASVGVVSAPATVTGHASVDAIRHMPSGRTSSTYTVGARFHF
ncbi:MAG: hypothetical protein H6911_03580 [Rickettsiaceae bacterium]|nr:hypothetical protein [Rickettsiaceae bacterium]